MGMANTSGNAWGAVQRALAGPRAPGARTRIDQQGNLQIETGRGLAEMSPEAQGIERFKLQQRREKRREINNNPLLTEQTERLKRRNQFLQPRTSAPDLTDEVLKQVRKAEMLRQKTGRTRQSTFGGGMGEGY